MFHFIIYLLLRKPNRIFPTTRTDELRLSLEEICLLEYPLDIIFARGT